MSAEPSGPVGAPATAAHPSSTADTKAVAPITSSEPAPPAVDTAPHYSGPKADADAVPQSTSPERPSADADSPAATAVGDSRQSVLFDDTGAKADLAAGEAPAAGAALAPTANGHAAPIKDEASSGRDASPSDDAPAKGGPPGGGADEPQRPRSKVVVLMLALCLAVFLAALDMTIITTALPTIAREFQTSEADYTWIGSCYLLAAAAAGPTWGKVSDIFGRKPTLLVANVVFFVGSLICALSINVQMLEAGRVLQGIGGGGLIILVNICISDLFSMRTRGLYFGFVGMTWAIASALGPILGGVFTQLVTWRWCFYINLPLDGIAFLILFVFLDIETPRTPIGAGLKAIDWLGSLSLVGGVVMFLLGLEFGGISFPWSSPTVICLIVFGLVTIGLFLIIEWRVARYPLVPLRLFSSRSNVACYTTCAAHGFVFISGSYFLPVYFQAVLGASPLLSGVYLLPFVLSLSFTSAFTGGFIKKTGLYRPPIQIGMALMTLGFGLYVDLPPQADWARIILFQIVAGLGTGPNFQSPLIALQTRVRPADIATATATFGTIRNLSTAVSVVIGGVIFQNQMAQRGPALAGPPANVPLDVLMQLQEGDAGASTGAVQGLPPGPQQAVHEAYTDSLRTLWIFYTVMGFVGLLCSFLIGTRVLSRDHTVTKTGLAAQEEGRKQEIEERAARKKSKQRGTAGTDTELGEGKETGVETPPKEG